MTFLNPHALWALPLAITPWLTFLTPPRNLPRVPFAALRLLSGRRERKRRSRRRVVQAVVQTMIIIALALLWASPQSAPKSSEPPAAATPALKSGDELTVLIIDASDKTRAGERSLAEYLELALDSEGEASNVDLVSYLEFTTQSISPARYDVVLLADLILPTKRDLDALKTYLKGSQSAVIVWSGAQPDTKAWREAILSTFNRNVEFATINYADATNQRYAPRQETKAEELFKATFPDFASSQIDALPIATATICYGPDATVVLRDVEHKAPIFTLIAPNLYWFAAATDPNVGALVAVPAFPALVENVTLFPARYNAIQQVPPETGFNFAVVLWTILGLGVILEALGKYQFALKNACYPTGTARSAAEVCEGSGFSRSERAR